MENKCRIAHFKNVKNKSNVNVHTVHIKRQFNNFVFGLWLHCRCLLNKI